jgi:hypothetical protein
VVTSKPANGGQVKTGQWIEPEATLCFLIRQVHFGSPTARAAFEHVTVMEEAVEHGGDRSAVTKGFPSPPPDAWKSEGC